MGGPARWGASEDLRPGADLALWSVVHSLAGLMADGALRAQPEAEQRARLAQVLDVVVAGLVRVGVSVGVSVGVG